MRYSALTFLANRLTSSVAVSLLTCVLVCAVSARAAAGTLQVVGTILKTFPDQSEAVMRVTCVTSSGGQAVTLSPPRVKLLIFRDGEIPFALAAGTSLMAEGVDKGRGKPLRVARVVIQGVETVFAETDTTGTDAGENPTAAAGTRADDGVSAGSDGVSGQGSAVLSSSRVSAASLLPHLPARYVLEGFERSVYVGWHMTGDCWGQGPEPAHAGSSLTRMPGAVGDYFLSTAHPRFGDYHAGTGTGIALSPEFPVNYRKLRFLIGGGDYPNECCLNLRVDGQVVRTATGDGTDRLSPVEWDISGFVGKRAQLEIVDSRVFGQRAYILLDEIEMDDPTAAPPSAIAAEPDTVGPAETEVVVAPPASPSLSSAAPSRQAPPLAPPATVAPVPPPEAPTRRPAAESAAPPAFVLLPDGTRVEGSRLLTLEATGYGPTDNGPWGDQTALGTTVGFGTVAVDPRVIPLHKHLWVEGYGFCIALDTGGAIKGMRIDLGQDSEEEAQAVGRQKRRVLVLD